MKKTWMESTLAGSWYSASGNELRSELQAYLDAVPSEESGDGMVLAAVLPHAGYAFSGPCAAHAVKALAARTDIKRVIVIGFSHRIYLPDAASIPLTETHYRSPVGETPLDTATLKTLGENPLFRDVPATRQGENSVELLLPILQVALPGDWQLVPITLGQINASARQHMADALRPFLDAHTVVLASSDFTHYGAAFNFVPFVDDIDLNLTDLDYGALEQIIHKNPAGFDQYCQRTGATICGQDSIAVLLHLLPEKATGKLACYDTSGRQSGNREHSVSYMSIVFRGQWAPPAQNIPTQKDELTQTDRHNLLKLARNALAFAFKHATHRPSPADIDVSLSDAMMPARGAFVTLTIDGELRGCIGEIFPRRPLAEVVVDHAINAAFEDTRFPPLSTQEFEQIKIEISVLSPPMPVASWRDIVIGKHGIVLIQRNRTAVFLPQVAPEQGWDVETTLNHLSMKAGLPAAAWKNPTTRFLVFEADVFRED